MAQSVRVRYAPSPTGVPHVGNIRTALFNWLFARHHGGAFLVRIEDTDQARKVEGATQAILESLLWLGLEWDEGPEPSGEGERGAFGSYYQSRRKEAGIYQRHADELVAAGQAYLCFCAPERLEAVREQQRRQGQAPMYDRHCRYLTDADRQRQEAAGLARVVRFKVPEGGETSFHDRIRGPVAFQNSTLDDFVLLKSDGYPTYHLANVVDDHLMQVTHVLRAEEWVSSTPRHLLLYQAFGWDPPQFAHLPMILGPDRSKLSKRHGATSLLEYRDLGYLPEAMMNFLALVGWSLDDRTEVISPQDLVRHFSIERVNKAAAVFNVEKLDWMNGVYIRNLAPDDFATRLGGFLERDLPPSVPRPLRPEQLRAIAPLVQERVKTLAEAAPLTDFFFVEPQEYDPVLLVQKGMDRQGTLRALETALARLEGLEAFDAASLEQCLRPLAGELGLKAGQLFGSVRVAVTGRAVAPPLFNTMALLGRDGVLARMRRAVEALREPL